MTGPGDSARRAELVAALAEVRRVIHDAATAVERDPRSVTLVAVTKTFPVADAAILAELGVLDLGESRDQEAKPKALELPEPRWHFVGRLQTNKCRSVAGYSSAVHTVDRAAVADALAAGVLRAERPPLRALIQVSLDGDPARGGTPASGVAALAEHIDAIPELMLSGVMAVAPRDSVPDEAFDALAAIAAKLRAEHPDASWISAGMSADLVPAIRNGATHVRVGSALLGRREPVVG
ncbi:MAG: YggS family pyridoxal phosphate-dependent enzyme [Jatrophihabitans sp.]